MKTVLFDFDGVIADSFTAAQGTAQALCKHNDEAAYRKHFEGNAWDTFHAHSMPDHDGCDHEMDWWQKFTSLFDAQNGLFEGMDATIKRLAGEYRLVIISSSLDSVITPFLEKHGLRGHFEAVYDAHVSRSKSEKIAKVFKDYETGAHECVMITDSKGDVLEAREQGVDSITVTWGYNDYDVLLSANPWRIVRLPDEIPNAVTEYFHGRHV